MEWGRLSFEKRHKKLDYIYGTYVTVVHPLKHLSRISIRGALATCQFGMVPKLSRMLPPVLINYLILPEIDAIDDKYRFHQI